jgi:thiamine monophosphate synthase
MNTQSNFFLDDYLSWAVTKDTDYVHLSAPALRVLEVHSYIPCVQ